jgi:hypothetical protein
MGKIRCRIQSEIGTFGKPSCYLNGSFWIIPEDPVFAETSNPELYYLPKIFVFIPHLIYKCELKCLSCKVELR